MIKIIYGTLTGNTERVALYLKEQFDMQGFGTELHKAEETKSSIFNQEDVFIVAASTWNLGEMNQFLQELYDSLPNVDLTGVKIAFVGLGDRIYGDDHFCKSIIDFRELSLERGAKEFVDTIYIDGEPEMVMDIDVKEWADIFIEKLKKN